MEIKIIYGEGLHFPLVHRIHVVLKYRYTPNLIYLVFMLKYLNLT